MASVGNSSKYERYGKEHQYFMQGIMSRGIMNTDEVMKLFNYSCVQCGVDVPEETRSKHEKLKLFIMCINNRIEELNLNIKKALDEESRYKDSFFVLCNKTDRSEDTSKLTQKFMLDFTPSELEYLRLILDSIIESETRQISQTEALLRAREVKTKKISQQDAERIIQKLLTHSWLRLSSDQAHMRLSTRFLAEMEPYLRDNYRDVIQNCNYCHKIVIRFLKCSSCEKEYHLHCLVATAPGGRKSHTGVCKECKTEIQLYLGDQEEEEPDRSTQRGGSKSKTRHH